MAQTGYTPIQLYYSTTASNTPVVANLSLGELAINLADQKAYILNAAGTAVVTLVGTLGNQNANSVSITGGSVNGTTIGATTASTGAFTTISATGVITSTVATGTAPFTIASTTQVANLNAATAGTATNATNTAITDNTSSSATWYPTIVSATTGNLPQTTSSTKLSFVPSTGTLTATSHAGAWAGSTIGTNYGGTGLTSFTSGGVVYASSTSALTTGSALYFDGTNLSVTGAIISAGAYSQFTSSGGGTSTTSVYVSSTGREPFVVTSSSGTDTIMHLTNTGTGGTDWQLRSTANSSAYGGGAFVFFNSTVKCILYSSGGLSLGNTTDKGAGSLNVSGLIYPQQAATASAPAYAKGAIYFDTTLNKLRVGGATAWETITSV